MDYLSSLIFKKYKKIHGDFLDKNADQVEWQQQYDIYGEKNYLAYIKDRNRNINILEIGSYLGHTLKWLKKIGFNHLYGVEIDEEAAEISKKYTGVQNIYHDDVFHFLQQSKNKFDVCITKAVFEHIERDKIAKLLELIYQHLNKNGRVIIVVPNMDWLLASHERYIDATHQIGFTRESLGEIMRLFFSDVNVEPFYTQQFKGLFGHYQKIMRAMSIFVLRRMFGYIGEGLDQCLFEYRAIKGIGCK